ncbi:glycolate oxidase subunit GlcE [Methylophaga sp. OBS4]|uniref:glycolate oxidase subunit GlcE n=1 Tax=Methylophaga sp. OBS4 TaxID=2991935 RepID=UPI002251BB02|nr:glycolate oxidase subunit GlcE [Methylophaga sp. OBS4]MCX4187251.1 glycolate oxidase subunit GlcE [Methylophaga sp. OBS4]
MTDLTLQLQQSVVDAIKCQTALLITGGGSKKFLGRHIQGQILPVSEHSGIISYQPTELVLTARAGTPLSEIEAALAEAGQILPFEPPHFADNATLGGTIAAGLSGSIRPFTGSARDYVLGCKIINGRGEILQFGGQVMKNVAGYDVSRLMVGAMGTLGLLLEISIKVLPDFPARSFLSQPREADDALRLMQTLSSQNLPLTGLAYDGEEVHIRLAGASASVSAARKKLGGEQHEADRFWSVLKEQTHHFFDGDSPLWRLSLPPATPQLNLTGKQMIDWSGGLRWIKTMESAERMFKLAQQQGGHAQLFRGGDPLQERSQPLTPAMLTIHQRLKASFDPHDIFNPGRLFKAI